MNGPFRCCCADGRVVYPNEAPKTVMCGFRTHWYRCTMYVRRVRRPHHAHCYRRLRLAEWRHYDVGRLPAPRVHNVCTVNHQQGGIWSQRARWRHTLTTRGHWRLLTICDCNKCKWLFVLIYDRTSRPLFSSGGGGGKEAQFAQTQECKPRQCTWSHSIIKSW